MISEKEKLQTKKIHKELYDLTTISQYTLYALLIVSGISMLLAKQIQENFKEIHLSNIRLILNFIFASILSYALVRFKKILDHPTNSKKLSSEQLRNFRTYQLLMIGYLSLALFSLMLDLPYFLPENIAFKVVIGVIIGTGMIIGRLFTTVYKQRNSGI